MFKKFLSAAAAVAMVLMASHSASATSYTYLVSSGTGLWSNPSNWSPTPSGSVGATAGNFDTITKTASTGSFLVNDESGASIAGISISGSSGYLTLTNSNSLTLYNGGNGATISSNSSSTSGNINIPLQQPLVLGDNLTISNNGSQTATYGVQITTPISTTGTYGVTINNASNNIAAGQVILAGSNSFTGGLTIQAGLLSFTTSTHALGAGVVNLGVDGGSNVTLLSTSGVGTVTNNINVGAVTSATLGSTSVATTTQTVYSGNIAFDNAATNTTLYLTGSNTSKEYVLYSGTISGAGNIDVTGAGWTVFNNNSNTFSG